MVMPSRWAASSNASSSRRPMPANDSARSPFDAPDTRAAATSLALFFAASSRLSLAFVVAAIFQRRSRLPLPVTYETRRSWNAQRHARRGGARRAAGDRTSGG